MVESKKNDSSGLQQTSFREVSSGWISHQRSLWLALLIAYLFFAGVLFYFFGFEKALAFLWGAGLFCISIAVTLKLMSSTVLGERGVRGMMFLSTLKFIVFAGLVFTGIVSLSLDPLLLFSGAFVGLVITSGYWLWASKKPASFC